MKKISFCIPTFPPHYKYAIKLYNSYLHYELCQQADFWFVFTNQEEKEIFEKLYGTTNCIIYDSNLGINMKDGIVNKKKFYALNILKEQYEYIIILDDENIFIKNIDIMYLCNSYFNNKVLYGNEVNGDIDFIVRIQNTCKKFFQSNENKYKLDTNLYLWFNQLCIYKSSTIPRFFKIIDYDNNLKNLNFFDFDYYIYMYYLILYENFNVEDIGITCYSGACENVKDTFIIKSNKYKNMQFMTSTKLMFDYLNNENLFVIMHIDRYNNDINYIKENINYMKENISYLNHVLTNIINSICWWIPMRKWRDDFRNKIMGK